MSSHHIVIEGQEPALIVAGSCNADMLSQLLEWNPLVIALNDSATVLHNAGTKIDVLVAASHPDEELIAQQEPITVLTPKKGQSQMACAVQHLVGKAYAAVSVIGASETETNEAVNVLLAHSHEINMVVVQDKSRMFKIPFHFEKWYTKNTRLLMRPAPFAEELRTQGLSPRIDNENLEMGVYVQAEADGVVTIEYRGGELLLQEEL